MSRFLLLLLLFFTLTTFSSFSEGSHGKKLPPTVVVGTVYCDTCSLQGFSRTSHFIAGASVAVECKDGNSKARVWKQVVRSNEHGEFRAELPFSVSKHVRRIKGCSVKLLKSSEPHCSVASSSSSSSSSSLSLKSRTQKEHIFSAGIFSFKPLQHPQHLCNNQNSKDFNSVKTLFPPNLDPNIPIGLPPLTPLPGVPMVPPLPELPPLPPVIGVPLPPSLPQNNAQHSTNKPKFSDQKSIFPPLFPPLLPPLVPNPFQPPPLIPNPFQPPSPPLIPNPFQPPSPPPLIPNPFQPPPSPTPLIPNPFKPPPSSPSPLFPLPPIPGFTPSPPPPPPPTFPFPFPPLFPPRSPGAWLYLALARNSWVDSIYKR